MWWKGMSFFIHMAWVFGVPEANRFQLQGCIESTYRTYPKKESNVFWIEFQSESPEMFFCLRDYAHEMSQKSPTWDLFVESKVTHNTSPQFLVFLFYLFFAVVRIEKKQDIVSRWWFQTKNCFTPNLREMILFDEHICSDGLVQPPSSYDHLGTPMICVGFKGWRFMKLGWLFSCFCC